MATIHHQQSRLATQYRVILSTESLRNLRCIRPDVEREFMSGGLAFSVIEQANRVVVNHAYEDIRKGITAAVIPHSILKPEAIFFDMDATVIVEESLVEIAKSVGKQNEIEQLTAKAMAGGMDFKDSLNLRLSMLKGLRRDQVLDITPTLNQGMKQFADWCHAHAVPIFLISGGFVDLAAPVAQNLGFKDFKANRFAWNGDIMEGRVDGEIVDGEVKRKSILGWCQVFNFNAKQCIVVGDGANDRQMMEAAGLAVGFSPKKALWPILQVANHSGDHRFMIEALTPQIEEDI